MQNENENIQTYPVEPENPNDYEGFEKSVYYIFSLLRKMYYSKVESENKFFSKLGGTVGGNVTIQGNLVVNGVNYSIDTTSLNVSDYTITLAKENTQTLTSMVGMVVPKYDGTNYGFFGWDADGYAYVGDLTDYDGTSDITLANNSSLQRIATIDASSLTTVANGKIMIWDSVAHTFMVAPNGTYVIKNGVLVQGYDKDDIDTNFQTKIDSSHKLDSDLVYDTDQDNKFVTANEKTFISDEYNKTLNIWDEQWELGAIDSSGAPVGSSNQIRSKNFIKVNPNAQYYFYNGDNTYTIYAFQYDSSYNFISSLNGLNTTVTTSSNCAYLKFYVNGHTTYNNDICINVSNASINGNYYPYNGAIVHEKDITPVLLWENSSPNSAFVPSDYPNSRITIADSSNFKFIVIGCKLNNGINNDIQYFKIKNSDGLYSYFDFIDGDGGTYHRYCRIIGTTQIEFANGRYNTYNGSATDDNSVCIPVEIYGTNIL